MKLSVFQPWSEFVLRGVLPEELTSKLIELTDIISQDVKNAAAEVEFIDKGGPERVKQQQKDQETEPEQEPEGTIREKWWE